MLRFGPVRFGFTSVYFGILMFGAVRFGTLSTRPLPPSTPATQPQTTPDLTPPGGAGGGETVRFSATKQARFGAVPVRFGTILQESIVETPMFTD